MKFFGLVILLLGFGCNFTTNQVSVKEDGIWHCSHPAPWKPDYRVDSSAETTELVLGIGSPTYVRFVDLNTGEIIRLKTDNEDWQCEKEVSATSSPSASDEGGEERT